MLMRKLGLKLYYSELKFHQWFYKHWESVQANEGLDDRTRQKAGDHMLKGIERMDVLKQKIKNLTLA